MTAPVFLSNRLHDTKRVLRIVSGVVILVFFTFYVSSGMVSGGLFFKSSFGQEYHTGMLLLAGITVFYTFFGGFMGASYTDMVQGLLMLAALIAVPVSLLLTSAGVGPVVESISQVRPRCAEHLRRHHLRRYYFVPRMGSGLLRSAAHYRAIHGDAHPRGR